MVMCKRIQQVIAFLLVFMAGNAYSQNVQLDSLENALKIHKTSDTVKVNLLNEVAMRVYKTDSAKAHSYITEAKELATKLNFRKGEAQGIWVSGLSLTYYKSFRVALDSLLKAVKIAEEINYKPGLINYLIVSGFSYSAIGNIPSAVECYEKAMKIAEELNSKADITKCLVNLSVIYTGQGNYDLALEGYQKALAICEETGDKKALAMVYNNIGNINEYKGNYPRALEYFHKSLKVIEERNDKQAIANSFLNIGGVIAEQGNYNEALEYFNKALKIAEELNDKRKISESFECIGNVYSKTNNPQAIEYLQKAMAIAEELSYTTAMLNVSRKIGEHYRVRGDYQKALEYYGKALVLAQEMNRKRAICEVWYKVGSINLSQKEYASALSNSLKSLEIANELKLLAFQRDINSQLAEIYAATNNFAKAYKIHKLFKELNDSINKEENIKKIIEVEYTYKLDKEKQAIELEQQKKDAIMAAQKRQQTIILFSFVVAFILMSVLAFYIYRSYLTKNETNKILTKQKHEIEEKNGGLQQLNEEISAQKEEISTQRDEVEKHRDLVVTQNNRIQLQTKEITDSIKYAKHIQQALLPSPEYAKSIMSDHFVLFKPKDIVSGDFYWSTQVNEFVVVTVADCTGHGIPGAFMSVLGISFLNEIVSKKGTIKASEILEYMRKSVIDALKQKWQAGETKDGMNMALIVLNTQTLQLQYAGAHNPLFIVSVNNELIEIAADKQPVAIHNKMEPFTNNETKIAKGDCIYLTSDGFQDQFGGPSNLKFKKSQLTELFQSIASKPMVEQKEILETTFDSWKGTHQQIDDVTILGMKV